MLSKEKPDARVKIPAFQIIPRALAAAGVGFFLVTLFSGPPAGLSEIGWRTLGGAVLMAAFWISEILPFPVTALLPLVLFPAAGIAPVAAAAAPYANPVIYLFLGGILIALAMESSNLHRRIALRIIGLAGVGRRAVIGGFLMASFFVSMWVNNTAVAVMMLPIAVSVMRLFKQETDHQFAPALLLAVAYGANIGGMSTLVGTAPNAILAGFLQETQGIEIGFLGWMILALPVSLILALVVWLVLTRLAFRVPGDPLPGGLELLDREHEALGPMTDQEKTVAIVFFVTAALWIARGFLEEWLPWLNDTTIAMAGGISLFLMPARRGTPEKILSWTQAQKIPWDVLVLIGGGLSLAAAIQKKRGRRVDRRLRLRSPVAARGRVGFSGRPAHRLAHRNHQQFRHHLDVPADCRRAGRGPRSATGRLGSRCGAFEQLRLHVARRHAPKRHRFRQRTRDPLRNDACRRVAEHFLLVDPLLLARMGGSEAPRSHGLSPRLAPKVAVANPSPRH